jgi:hypothetical protein
MNFDYGRRKPEDEKPVFIGFCDDAPTPSEHRLDYVEHWAGCKKVSYSSAYLSAYLSAYSKGQFAIFVIAILVLPKTSVYCKFYERDG